MRIEIKAPQRNSRTTFRQSEIDRLKEIIYHQGIRINELERMLKMENIDKDEQVIKAAHLAIRSVFSEYRPEWVVISTRKRDVVELRQMFQWLCRNKTTLSLQKIGQICGGRDHSTVINSCRVVDNLMSYDKRYARNLETVKNKFEEFAEQI
jgi:chromosomal replication initiator protein